MELNNATKIMIENQARKAYNTMLVTHSKENLEVKKLNSMLEIVGTVTGKTYIAVIEGDRIKVCVSKVETVIEIV